MRQKMLTNTDLHGLNFDGEVKTKESIAFMYFLILMVD